MHHDLQLPKIVVLVLLAVGLGIGILQLDTARRADLVPSANAASNPPAPAADAAQLVADGGTVQAVPAAVPAPAAVKPVARMRGGVTCDQPHRTVQVRRDVILRARPNGRRIGTLPSSSKYLGQPTTAWVQAVSADGRWGKVTLPWSKPVARAGWVRLDGLAGRRTSLMVVADLSERRVHVYRGCRQLFSVRSAIGRPGSPSPMGRFWVTDRVPVPGAQQASFGTYAFGLSTVQPNLPAGWTGGDQMAIHGTGAPGSIGEAASAGCLRVSEGALARLKPLLRVGTPVVIRA